MPRTLAELRTAIDKVDRELLARLNERAGLANEVGEIKRAEGSPFFRPDREAEVINKLQQANTGPLKGVNVAHISKLDRASLSARRRAKASSSGTRVT